MEIHEVEFGKTCWFYGTDKGVEILKRALITGPWNREYPGYVGVKDITAGGFCYVEASRLFYSLRDEPKQENYTSGRREPHVPEWRKTLFRAKNPEQPKRNKMIIV